MLASFMIMYVYLMLLTWQGCSCKKPLPGILGYSKRVYWRGKSVKCVTAQDFIDLALDKETVKRLEGEQEFPEQSTMS